MTKPQLKHLKRLRKTAGSAAVSSACYIKQETWVLRLDIESLNVSATSRAAMRLPLRGVCAVVSTPATLATAMTSSRCRAYYHAYFLVNYSYLRARLGDRAACFCNRTSWWKREDDT